MAMSSTTLSVLSFALTSWLEGSSQLRTSLVNPSALTLRHDDTLSINPTLPAETNHAPHPLHRLIRWFGKPQRDLDEVEKTVLGILDVSVRSTYARAALRSCR